MRFVRRSFAVPDCAATHPHWFVQLWVEWAILVFANRARLDRPIRDLNGHVVVRALPEWHLRPYCPDEDADELDSRRADFMQGALATLLAGIAHMSFVNKTVLPSPNAPDYMTLHEWAEHLPGMKCADPIDAIERPMRFLKMVGVFSFTKQHRQKLTDGPNAGKFRSCGAALRRFSLRWMKAMDGIIAGGVRRLQTWLDEREKKQEEDQAEADEAFTEELTRRNEPLLPRPPRARHDDERAPDPDLVCFEQVEREHPDWIANNEIAKINAEVRRLKAAAAGQRDTS